MTQKGLTNRLSEIRETMVSLNEPMSRHTSLGVGGPADVFITVTTEKALAEVIEVLEDEQYPWIVIGAGTNLLVMDDGIAGAVIKLGGEFCEVQFQTNEDQRLVIAGAGVPIARLLREVEAQGAWGLEFLTGIPGTVGGAVFMNAGTRYGYVESALKEVKLLDNREISWHSASVLNLTYRGCSLEEKALILAAAFVIHDGRPDEAVKVAEDLETTRRLRHPPMIGTAGSFFKNPDMSKGLFAGKLIESAGLKGRTVGGAMVSPKHANFLVNTGKAKAIELLELAETVRKEVERQFGVSLVPEVRIVGRGADLWHRRLGVGG